MLIKRKFYWHLSGKKELCCCLKLLHVSVLLTLIYFDFQERNEHHNSQGMLCLPLSVCVNTKGCPSQLLCKNGKQITVGTNLAEAPVPLCDRHWFLLASSVTVLLW